MHFKNALNAFIYTVFRAFFTQSLAKFRIYGKYTHIFIEKTGVITYTVRKCTVSI